MSGKFEEFDWLKYGDYKGGNRLTINSKVIGQDNKNRCYCHEPYAQELFGIYSAKDLKIVKKDLTKGDCVPVSDVFSVKEQKMTIGLSGGLSIDVDLSREKRFLQLYGYETVDSFINDLLKKGFAENFISQGIFAYVIESSPTVKVSLWQGHLKQIKEEFMEEISAPSKAYVAKVMEANKGGYFVEVQGVEAFMPGSLAAPNKIVDFRTLVGKEVIVMIEDFLVEMNSFIVSHKKYVDYVLPKKIAELDLSHKYEGTITGTSKYGIFIEFDIFTGLLHTSKMKDLTAEKFNRREYKAGDTIEFYINEITRDNRIILTEESPTEKTEKLTKFVENNKDKTLRSEVAAIMNFGVIVNVGELSGLIPNKEFKRMKMPTKNLLIGDKLDVVLFEFKDEKIIFNLNDKGA